MSLVRHISPIEGVDRDHVPSSQEPYKPIRRQLSYDAFPQPADSAQDKARIAAYKASVSKRLGKCLQTIPASHGSGQ